MITFKALVAYLIPSAALVLAAAGCAHDTGPVVPSGAMQVASGNKMVAFTAPAEGKVYLRDDNDNHVLYSADVRRNQVVKYDPQSQQVMVDGAVAASKIPGDNHDHTIFFERADRSVEPTVRPAAAASSGGDVTTDANGVHVIRVPVGVQVDVTQPSTAGQ